MTNEEFARVKASIKAQMEGSAPPVLEETAERRKLDRDMDRLERALKKIVSAPMPKRHRADKPSESDTALEQQRAKTRAVRARSDAKLKALMEKPRRKSNTPPQS